MSNVLVSLVITLVVGLVIELFKPEVKAFGGIIRRKPFESTVIVGLLIITILLIVMMRS